jgi:hypothetical protein
MNFSARNIARVAADFSTLNLHSKHPSLASRHLKRRFMHARNAMREAHRPAIVASD